MGRFGIFATTICWFLLVASTFSSPVANAVSGKTEPPSKFRIVGYLPDYRVAEYDLNRASSLTDLILFSAEPSAEGGIDLSRLKQTPWATLKSFKTDHQIRLILCIGGWERSTHFATIATSDEKTEAFVESAVRLCLEHRLDGIDIDWEHPENEAQQEGYGRMLASLRSRFQEHGLKLSVTIAAWQKMNKLAIDSVDWVNVMAYDHDGPHSTFDGAKKDVRLLLDAGFPAEKLTLGLPFYGRHLKDPNKVLTYREIMSGRNLSPAVDEVDQIAFNGPATIRRKTEFAREAKIAGVMIWELGQDADDDQSLLKVICKTAESVTSPSPKREPNVRR